MFIRFQAVRGHDNPNFFFNEHKKKGNQVQLHSMASFPNGNSCRLGIWMDGTVSRSYQHAAFLMTTYCSWKVVSLPTWSATTWILYGMISGPAGQLPELQPENSPYHTSCIHKSIAFVHSLSGDIRIATVTSVRLHFAGPVRHLLQARSQTKFHGSWQSPVLSCSSLFLESRKFPNRILRWQRIIAFLCARRTPVPPSSLSFYAITSRIPEPHPLHIIRDSILGHYWTRAPLWCCFAYGAMKKGAVSVGEWSRHESHLAYVRKSTYISVLVFKLTKEKAIVAYIPNSLLTYSFSWFW